MNYTILGTGDHIISVTEKILAVEHEDRSVTLYPLQVKGGEIILNANSTTIAYSPDNSDNCDDFVADSGVQIVTF